MTDWGLVSIISPAFNCGRFIHDTIESVQAQTYEHWELIIIDDCSTDSTEEGVRSYLKDERIRYLRNETNLGAALSRNRALREAKGRWIAFLDADDLWKPEKLERQLGFMVEQSAVFSYTAYNEINEAGAETGIHVSGPNRITKAGMFAFCWPGCLTVMYDCSVIGLIQIEDIKKNNDYAMWLQVCRKADCFLLDETLALYRRGRPGSISSHSIRTMIRWHYRLFREGEKMGVLRSAFHTCINLVFGLYKKHHYVRREKKIL